MKKDFEITFAPGAFDGFDGTQEELEALMEEIVEAINSGEIFKDAQPIDEDDEWAWEAINQKNLRH